MRVAEREDVELLMDALTPVYRRWGCVFDDTWLAMIQQLKERGLVSPSQLDPFLIANIADEDADPELSVMMFECAKQISQVVYELEQSLTTVH
jgi:uncharacterized protein YjhX (UPF0386 family)